MNYNDVKKNKIIKIEKKEWNNIIKKDENSTIFHLFEWGDIMEDVHNMKFICISEGDSVLPLSYVKSFIFGNRLISMPFADYGGPSSINVNKKDVDQILKKTIKIANNLNVDFVEIRSPSDSYISFFEENGFEKRYDYATFKINLEKNEKELWLDMESERRTAIRKSEENELNFLDAYNFDDLKDFYRIYLQRMKGIGSPPQPFNYFKRLWNEFYPDNLRLSFVETKERKRIATALFFIFKTTLYYTYGASSQDYWDLRPNDFLFWNVMTKKNKQKFCTLDLGRTRIGSGVYLFKKKWGGEKVKMPYLYYFKKKRLEERQEIKYDKFSKRWSKYMPSYFAEKVGPWIIKQIG